MLGHFDLRVPVVQEHDAKDEHAKHHAQRPGVERIRAGQKAPVLGLRHHQHLLEKKEKEEEEEEKEREEEEEERERKKKKKNSKKKKRKKNTRKKRKKNSSMDSERKKERKKKIKYRKFHQGKTTNERTIPRCCC